MNSDQKKNISQIFTSLALLCAAVIILDFGFFSAQVQYFLLRVEHKPTAAISTQATGQPDSLQVPSLNISVPIVYATEKNETAYQAALVNGVVHYPGTANPGQLGNAYIFGHSSDFIWSKGHYKTAFALLPKIQLGAKIQITDHQGNLFTYEVVHTAVVSPTDLSVLDQGGNAKKILTLQTSYPVGTALKRFVAQAEIVQK